MTNFLFFFFAALLFALALFILSRVSRRRATLMVAFAMCAATLGTALATTIGGYVLPPPSNISATAPTCNGTAGRGTIYVALTSTGGSVTDQLAFCGAGASGATPAWRRAAAGTGAAVVFP